MSTIRFSEDDEERAEQHGALDHRQVALLDRVVGEPADAGDVEDGLGEDRAAEQDADVEPEDRDDRRDRAAHAVAQDDAALAQALGARGADVVLAHHLDQVAAQQPRVDRRERGGEHEPRQDQRREPLARVAELAADVAARALEDRELADVRREQVERRPGRASRRAPRSRPARRPSRRGRASVPRLTRGDDADRDPDRRSQTTAAPTASEIVAGRRSKICVLTDDVVLVAVAEVEVEDELLHVVPVLHVPRLVEPEVVPDRCDELRGRRCGRRAAAPGRPTGSR